MTFYVIPFYLNFCLWNNFFCACKFNKFQRKQKCICKNFYWSKPYICLFKNQINKFLIHQFFLFYSFTMNRNYVNWKSTFYFCIFQTFQNVHNHRDDSFGAVVRHVIGRNSHDSRKYSNELNTGLFTQTNMTKTPIFLSEYLKAFSFFFCSHDF